jgi:hypothetical protein
MKETMKDIMNNIYTKNDIIKDIYTKNDIIIFSFNKYNNNINNGCRFLKYIEMYSDLLYYMDWTTSYRPNIRKTNDLNINNLPLCKILVVLDEFVTSSLQHLYFERLPPSLEIIYIPVNRMRIEKDYYEKYFRLPYGCKIKYYKFYSEILELQQKYTYQILTVED